MIYKYKQIAFVLHDCEELPRRETCYEISRWKEL
jgi:hypothetical protein